MKNILVVDDNKLIAEGLAIRIGILIKDARVHTAANGKEAVDIFETVPMDLVITDIQMPVMNGYELITHCRKNRPRMPLYAMTGDCSPETEARLSGMGIPMSVKPFDFDEMAYRVSSELDVRKSLKRLFT